MAPVHSVLALWPGASAVQVQAPSPDSVVQAWDSVSGRQAIWTWLVTRRGGVKLAMAGAVGAALLLVPGAGVKAYDCMMHDNDPCLPFPTTKALREISSREPLRGLIAPWRTQGQGAPAPEDEPPERGPDVSVSRSDTFPHERHRRLACLTCHDLRAKRRALTFEAPRGCQVCHHQRPAQTDCASCHHRGELAATLPVQVAVAVPRHDRRRRTVQFPHAKHDTLACTSCHARPVTMAPADSALTCVGCHAKHHAESRDCAACHRTAAITAPHQAPIQPHLACDRCHTPATVARLVPTRSFCLACHEPQQDHYAPKECSTCHFQRTPEELQRKLHREGAPS